MSAGCLLLLGAVYGGANLSLLAVASWAERAAGAYPYWRGENSIRYLLPTLHARSSRPRLLLMGASTSEEALLHEEFEAAFPEMDVLQGSMSSATLDDLIVALEYLRCNYGPQSLPEVLVIGLDVRTVGNFPRHFGPGGDPFDDAPLLDALRNYSFRYTVAETPWGSRLVPRPFVDGLRARLRFLTVKQQPRYRAGLVKLLDVCLNGRQRGRLNLPELPPADTGWTAWLRTPLNVRCAELWIAFVRQVGFVNALRRWSREFVSPYDIKYRPHVPLEEVRDYVSQYDWIYVKRWDPQSEAELVQQQLGNLAALARAHEIELFLVNMPEHRLYREQRPPEYYAAYVQLVRESLPEAHWLDLHGAFPDEDFADSSHLTYAAGQRLTRQVIPWMKQALTSPHKG